MTGPTDQAAVVCVNGGRRRQVEGTWSASLEWLVDRLAPRFPELRFAEVRYRIKSWERLDWCIEDAEEAISEVGASRVLMLGFYVPMAFLLDRFVYQRHVRKEAQKRAEREAQRTGARQAEG